MKNNNKVYITPSSIPSEQERSSGKLDLNGIFDNNFFQPEDTQYTKTSSKKSKKSKYKNVKSLDLSGIKETLRPSLLSGETNYGGKSTMQETGNSIFEPDHIKDIKESKMSKQVQKDAQEKRAKRNSKRRDNPEARAEWEQVKPAQKTSDVPAGQMGFTPNRSALEPKYQNKKYKVTSIEQEKERIKRSSEAGKEAAKIKSDLDKIMMDNFEKKAKGDWDWEKDALEKINNSKQKNIEVNKESIKLAKEFTPTPKKDNSIKDLSGIFKPLVPEIDNKPIKRDASKIKEKRTSRKDDRSWEKLSKPTKFKI